jgi:hypothetical protein
MDGFDGAQARHDANTEPREYPRCAPSEHNYYMPKGDRLTDGLEVECDSCESVVVSNLVEIQ